MDPAFQKDVEIIKTEKAKTEKVIQVLKND